MSSPLAPATPGSRSVRRLLSPGLLFALPFLVLFAVFMLWPLGQGLWMSLTDTSLSAHTPDFIGLDNFSEAVRDAEMWRALGHTVWFTALSTVPLVAVALGMALLVHTGLPGQWVWRLAFFAPYLLPVGVVGLLWIWLYQPDLGLYNHLLDGVGLGRVAWLSDPSVAMSAIVLTTLWWTVGFNFLLYLAALQSVPDHLYEAAAIDGAGAWRRLWSITLPQLGRITTVVTVLQILASLKVFDQVYLLTKGGPDNSTRPVVEYVYDVGFTGYRLGYASAISYVFFALVVLASAAQYAALRRREK
ncbi:MULTISPECIES: carbohydrate ABC transporter permease [Streptomyces]|uniref:Sugar ABC transporter permease n=1 Tax=Streptomyces doudnae TaxID=3075536 RepID=A0ABD5ES00_9ACTN|nr:MULTISPECIES: sugar ABC transporter permease [unclassified Streptomyces]MDT0437380.1 sugar ABC transporter permease [Streptomyces sp. DSM 41981]MYQ62974.1 ABC transporter permease subunit [Streptomyces sp. SID4950]SCD48150.1 carbohydrate ABC transporter membrane protein 1, CUT1 family [Streptomyces sp. SolWspMP-5a-2]